MEADKNLLDERKILQEKERQKKIKKEIAKFKKIFTGFDKNKTVVVNALIQNAAFMYVTLQELEEVINREGCISEYKNGENQYGTKKSPEVEIHIAMTKNYATVMKQLSDLVPPEKRKDSRLAAMQAEAAKT